MRIRTKILALVGALSLIAVAISGVGIHSLMTFDRAVDDTQQAATRALYSERLNRLVTGVVMEARGVYAAKDTKDAQQYATGILKTLGAIDDLLRDWAPLVPDDEKPLFERVVKEAAAFKAFRTETARLGTEVSVEAANAQGFNDANRANRKAFQDGIDALTQHSNATVKAVNANADALYESRFWLLVGLTGSGLVASLLIGVIMGHVRIRARFRP